MSEPFWAKVDKSGGPTACWLWQGYINDKGYGLFGKGVRAHRIAYEHINGPIEKPLILDHLCRVRHCVNPSHLEAVTHQTNILRGLGLTAREAVATHCPKGHPYDEVNTYRTPRGWRDCRACRSRAFQNWKLRKRAANV